MQTLREEILQAQRTRSDLLKWKLGLVGVIRSVGLGLAGSRVPTHAELVLCAIPFGCVYVDLLCRHLWLRASMPWTGFGQWRDSESSRGHHYFQTVVRILD